MSFPSKMMFFHLMCIVMLQFGCHAEGGWDDGVSFSAFYPSDPSYVEISNIKTIDFTVLQQTDGEYSSFADYSFNVSDGSHDLNSPIFSNLNISDSFFLEDMDINKETAFSYLIEAKGEGVIESTECCGTCNGMETVCRSGWECVGYLCQKSFDNIALFRGVIPEVSFEDLTYEFSFSPTMSFSQVTNADGEQVNMLEERNGHKSVTLQNGKVLIIGGEFVTGSSSQYIPTAELFDPAKVEFTELNISGWTGGRSFFTINPISASNTVNSSATPVEKFLIVGGKQYQGESSEVYIATYNAENNIIDMERIGDITPVVYHTVTDLENGKFLVCGGSYHNLAIGDTYIIDVNTRQIEPVDTMLYYRYKHTATYLPGGKVIVAGGIGMDGYTVPQVDVFDVATKQWSTYEYDSTNNESDNSEITSRAGHIAIPIIEEDVNQSRVVIYGGYRYNETDAINSDVYNWNLDDEDNNMVLGVISPNGKVEKLVYASDSGYKNKMSVYGSRHCAVNSEWTWLGNSRNTVLVVGGECDNEISNWAEIINFGTYGDSIAISPYVIEPGSGESVKTPHLLSQMNTGRSGFSLNKLKNDMYLVAGGLVYEQGRGYSSSTCEILNPPAKHHYWNIVEENTPDGDSPTAIVELPKEYQNPEPLDVIHLDGQQSVDANGENSTLEYWWEWAPDGKPFNATDSILIAEKESFNNPVSIMNQWTTEGYPKIYFPISGHYKIRLKVRDANQIPSKDFAEIEIVVRPSRKIHVELTWDRGDDVDLDLFLVRFRTDGTFASYSPSSQQNLAKPTSTIMPECETDADCFSSKLNCGYDGVCENYCETDNDCTIIDKNWHCNTAYQCAANEYIPCDYDSDCPNDTYCTAVIINSYDYPQMQMVCTKYPTEVLNDTVWYSNKIPRWGDYHSLLPEQLSCLDDYDCNGLDEEIFTCDNSICDFSCNTSSECLTYSDQFLCSQDVGECIANDIDDDPTLDIDDVNGWGPENISIEDPSSGLYRVVVRFYSDHNRVVNDSNQFSWINATINIYLNGEKVFSDGISHLLKEPGSYWKVADIAWDANLDEKGGGTVIPVCAGWTDTQCSTSDECKDWFSDEYSCSENIWQDKYCTSCESGEGTPEECPGTTLCSSDADCVGETGKTCTTIKGSFCKCEGYGEFGSFSSNPYANPFTPDNYNSFFNPKDTEYTPRSIWCDSPSESTKRVPDTKESNATITDYEIVNIFGNGNACSDLY